MAYHGYISFLKQLLLTFKEPSVLEIGVDKGITTLSLATFLARKKEKFCVIGVDILLQDHVKIMCSNLDLQQGQDLYLIEDNSLVVLPKCVEHKMMFDVVLLDGDHNYHTVLSELQSIQNVVHNDSVILIDDYDGRWSERDLWYSERPGYEDNKLSTQKIDTEKHGVKPAVDQWLSENPEWKLYKPIQGEPVLLSKKDLT